MKSPLKPAELPDSVETLFYDNVVSATQGAEALNAKLKSGEVHFVGFDLEWTVQYSNNGVKKSPIGLIQFALQDTIYLFHVARCSLSRPRMTKDGFRSGQLPRILHELLNRTDIIKVGSCVNNDITLLNQQYGLEMKKGIDLASLARSRGVDLSNNGSSLKALAACVLKKHLPKEEEGIRISDWDGPLGDKQKRYAALDAYVSLQIWTKLQERIGVGEDVTPQNVRAGMRVAIYANTAKSLLVGYGIISSIEITKNFNRAKQCKVGLSIEQENIVRPDVKVKMDNEFSLLSELRDNSKISTKYLLTAEQPTHDPMEEYERRCSVESLETTGTSETVQAIVEVSKKPPQTRVLLDPYHWFRRISECLDTEHGAFFNFMRELSNAVFKWDESDKAKVEAFLSKQNIKFDDFYEVNDEWIKRRVRRTIPDERNLNNRVQKVIDTYKGHICAKSNEVLIPNDAMKRIEECMKHVKNGCLSDPDDIQLYYELGKDKDGLMKYRSIRGTCSNEGTVHRNIKAKFGAYNAGIRLAYCMLLDFCTMNNMSAAHRNRGDPNYGHFDPWLLDETVRLTDQLDEDFEIFPAWIPTQSLDFRNVFIIGPYHNETDNTLYEPFDDNVELAKTFKFLAEKTNMKYPLTPVNTIPEMALFKKYQSEGVTDMLERWNAKADGKTIFYKMQTHLDKHMEHRTRAIIRDTTVSVQKIQKLTYLEAPVPLHDQRPCERRKEPESETNRADRAVRVVDDCSSSIAKELAPSANRNGK